MEKSGETFSLEEAIERLNDSMTKSGSMIGDDTGVDPSTNPPQQSSDLESKITKLQQQSEENRVLTQLLADPDLAAVLRAKQAGQKISVLTEQELQAIRQGQGQSQPTQQDQQVDFDSMKPAELVQYMLKQMNTQLPSIVESKIKPLGEKLAEVDRFMVQREVERAKASVDAARQKFPDFDQYIPQMQELTRQNPNLNAEELYVLAKVRSGQPLVQNTRVESERPSQTSSRPPVRSQNLEPGRAGMVRALDNALSRVRINHAGEE